jgi:hypothetical protein
MPSKYNHRRFYSAAKSRIQIPKFDIKAGMIVTFPYRGYDKRPLIFVMDTDEFVKSDKKSFSGINLNYLPIAEVNKFFIKLLNRAGWEVDRKTKAPKVDLWDEDDPGVKVKTLYNALVKKQLLDRGKDCWRTYKYSKVRSVFQVKFEFDISPLREIMNEDFTKVKKISKSTMYRRLKGDDEKSKQPEKPKTEVKKPQQPKKPKQVSKLKKLKEATEIDNIVDATIKSLKAKKTLKGDK